MTIETETAAALATGTRAWPRYPAYRASGVEWLGEIPAHWKGMTIRAITSEVTERGYPDYQLLSVYRDFGVVIKESRDDNHNRPSLDLSAYKLVRPGRLVLNKMKTWQGSLAVSEHLGIVSPAYITCDLRDGLDTRYVHCVLRSTRYICAYNQLSYGVRVDQWDMRYEDFKQLPIFLPPLPEQRAIAAFLDRETARIDALVAAKERLIALLREKRAALISHAVTRGLNPTAPMRDSGVPWLGEIPAHWEVKALGYVLSYVSYGFTNPMPTASDGPYMLTAFDIGDGIVKYNTARHTTEQAFATRITEKSRPRKGDILLTKDGTLGRVALFDGSRACINQSVAILRTVPATVTPEYLCVLLAASTYQDRMTFDAGGTTIKHIYISKIVKMAIAFPSLDEQRQILSYLNRETAKLDMLIAKVQRHIEKVKEYRAALIAAAVTGKIDVRGGETANE